MAIRLSDNIYRLPATPIYPWATPVTFKPLAIFEKKNIIFTYLLHDHSESAEGARI